MRLAIVVPCYNEEKVLAESAKRLTGILQTLMEKKKVAENSFVLFVNDGSKDKTWTLIEELFRNDKHVFGLSLALNRGHQNALLAGLMSVKDICDAAVSIDADLQDDVDCIESMVDAYAQGFDIVYGVRSSRKSDTFFKRTTALAFYRLMSWLGAFMITSPDINRPAFTTSDMNGLPASRNIRCARWSILPSKASPHSR